MYVKWDITYKCNLNCAHCMNGDMLGDVKNELTLSDIDKILNDIRNYNLEYIHFLGGEPTARKDILDIFNLLQNQNINFGFNTNGLKFHDLNFIKNIINNKSLKRIVFSLEGPTAELNDTIRGRKVFDITTANIKNLISERTKHKNCNFIIIINMVLTSVNKNYIKDMITFCENLGADELSLLKFIPSGNGKGKDLALSIQDELQVINDISEIYSNKTNIKINPKFARPLVTDYVKLVLGKDFPTISNLCGAGSSLFYIDNKGNLYPCDRYRDYNKSIEKDKINIKYNDFCKAATYNGYDHIFEANINELFYKDIKPCNNCKYLQKSCFPCPEQIDFGYNIVNICKFIEEELKNVQIS